MFSSIFLRRVALAAALASTAVAGAHAQPGASDISAASVVPIASSVALSTTVITAGATLSVASVQASADGTTWVLQRTADGARFSVHVAGGASVAVGTALTVTAVAAGWVLSEAGHVVAFIPNQIGAVLLHNERITP